MQKINDISPSNVSRLNESKDVMYEKKIQSLFLTFVSLSQEPESEAFTACTKKINNIFSILNSLDKKNERLSQLLKDNDLPFSNADSERYSKLRELIPMGTGMTGLANADDPVPPVGTARYSAEERAKLLNQIVFRKTGSQNKEIGPGCSLIIDLLADELRESYLAFNLKVLRNADVKGLLKIHHDYVESWIGSTSIGAFTLGKFQGEIHSSSKKVSHKIYQDVFFEAKEGFLERIFTTQTTSVQNNFKKMAEYKRYEQAYLLLEDFVTQELHRLFSPLLEAFDPSEYFCRLHRRAENFLRILNGGDAYAGVEKTLLKKHSKLLERQNALSMGFCKTIIPKLEKLQNKNDPQALAELWKTLIDLNSDQEINKHQSHLADQLVIEKNTGQKDSGHVFFYDLCLRQQWSQQSLLNQTRITMLVGLIKASQVSNLEIDSCIANLIEVVKNVMSYQVDDVQLRLKSLPEDDICAQALRQAWKNFEYTRLNGIVQAIRHIEIRLERCCKNPNDEVERALALRDTLHFFAGHIRRVQDYADQFMEELLSLISLDEEPDPELIKLHQEMHNLNTMQRNGLEAAVEGIKALIGRCFTEMDFYTQIEDEKRGRAFELESSRAKKAGEELIKSEKFSRKQNTKKRTGRPLPQVKVEKIVPKNLPVNPIRQPIKVEVKPKQSIQTTTKEESEAVFKDLPKITAGLLICETRIEGLKISLFAAEDSWQNKQMLNLDYLIEGLLETQNNEGYSVDLIFEQTDLLRRSIEALLGIATVYTRTSYEEIQAIGHDAEGLLEILLGSTKVPENTRKLLWKMRDVPISLKDGNRCVNYPARTDDQQEYLGEGSRQLLKFLIKVEREGHAAQKDENLRKELTAIHHSSLQRGIFFMEQLLEALLHPSKVVDGELPPNYIQKIQEKSVMSFSTDGLIEGSALLTENSIEHETLNILSINSRGEALLGIDTALIWIGIRCIAPIEGTSLMQWRTKERNIALRNCGIYLRRLKEKLGPDRSIHPMSTILGQCDLLRRLQKELLIAALYHTDSFVDGQHIVQARNIRFSNSPCFLMGVLRNVSTRSKELPGIGGWMHRAHQVLSYPASQAVNEGDFSVTQLQKLVQEVRQASKELRLGDETLVEAYGKLTPQKREKKRRKLVEANESQKIFPGLAAFLYTLKFGLSLPKHKYLNDS